MKIQFILIYLFIIGITPFHSSCKKDSPANCSTTWAKEIQDELNAFNTASQAYAANQNATTCNAYKTAATNYVNALKPIGNCSELTGQNRSDWQASLNAAQASVAAITC
ncbi:MAG: hypothetical protein ABIR66_08755 [Saprospiraceae bacterium]